MTRSRSAGRSTASPGITKRGTEVGISPTNAAKILRLMKREQFIAAMEEAMGGYISSGFRGESFVQSDEKGIT